MSLPRFFVNQSAAPGDEVQLDEGDSRHIARVLRLKTGDFVVIVSGRTAWQAKLTTVTSDGATARLIGSSTERSAELPVEVTVLQALPKASKMDEIVEKVVELGAARIVPVRCERSYGGDSENKLERWRRIARSAAQQSRRLIVPVVDAPLDFKAAIKRFTRDSRVMVAHEQAPQGSLAAALQRNGERAIALAIGPEGSFTESELSTAAAAQCDIVSLGPIILRTETAAAALLAAIAALRGWW